LASHRGAPGFETKSGHVAFVVANVALGQVFCDISFPYQFSSHRLLSSGVGTIGQIVADVPSGLSHPTHEKLKKYVKTISFVVS
jgi:hypothetical protein